MAVTNELAFPETEDRFEEMCFNLYRKEWNDPGCVRLGGTGQGQFGLDILGTDGTRQLGVQCKHYVKTPFTLGTVEKDVGKADEAGIEIDHLIFATTAASKSELVIKVRALSEARRKAGKFTVSVAFWQELSGLLRMNKDVAREYIPGFPGGTLLQVQSTTEATLAIVQSSSESDSAFQAEVRGQLATISDQVATTASASSLPQAQGTEAEPLIANSLDMVRQKVVECHPQEALSILDSLGNPDRFRDTYSQFRWHTNRAAAQLLLGNKKEAAREYLAAAAIEPGIEKAYANRAHAHLLLGDTESALNASNEGLGRFPQSAALWSLHVASKHMAGDPVPEQEVPAHILETTDVQFTLSHVRSKQGRLEESLDLIRKCAEGDAPSLETKRHYLAAALSWATSDRVAAHHGQLQVKQRAAVADAVGRLEPLEGTLAAQTLDDVSDELANNICVGLYLNGHRERARAIASTALERHPHSEGLLRFRVNELAEKDDMVGVHQLTDGRHKELPTSTLASLAEISANRGDLPWHTAVVAELRSRDLPEYQLEELAALGVHATWMAGARDEAILRARSLLAQRPAHVLTRIILSRMLDQRGEAVDAAHEAGLAIEALTAASSTADVLFVADLLYERELYPEAAALYERVVTAPGPDILTQRYMVCLIESGHRRKVRDLLEGLPAEVRALPTFRRIESNLARQMGDWPRMRDVLKEELERVPSDSGVALGYVGALHHMPGEGETLRAYLASDPVYDGKQPLNEVEVAKYQRNHGFPALALKRLYKLFRGHPNDAALGGYFLAQILVGERVPELDPPQEVRAGVAVHLRSGGEARVIAIDVDAPNVGRSWPELVVPSDDVAARLLGKRPGDTVALSRGMGDVLYDVVGLSSLYVFAAEKAHKLIAETANPGGPLWSINLERADGHLDIEPLLASAREKSLRIARALESYVQLRFPLATLAKLVGTEPLTLMLDWPSSKASLFVSIGTHEERQAGLNLLQAGNRRFVFDLPTLGELVGCGVFRDLAPLLGRPLVPRTAREELANILAYQEATGPHMSLREENGQYIREETTDEQFRRRVAFLREVLSSIDELCDVTPVVGPQAITASHRNLESWLDPATLDAVYLALERESVLVSEDGGLRLQVPAVGLTEMTGLQPLLMFAREKGAISHETYVDVVMGKVARNHDFISIRTEDLLLVARRNVSLASPGVIAALETFRKPGLDINSGVQVCGEFLAGIVPICPPAVTSEYFRRALDVLQHGRPMHAEAIHRALADAIEHGLERVPKKRGAPIRRQMGGLLRPPELRKSQFKFTPVAYAVKELVVRMRRYGEKTA